MSEFTPTGPRETFRSGETVWFEYHCDESDRSADTHLRDRSHQRVRIVSVDRKSDGWACGIKTRRERLETGVPIAYTVQFEDGLKGTAIEDELSYSRASWCRPDPPHNRNQAGSWSWDGKRMVADSDAVVDTMNKTGHNASMSKNIIEAIPYGYWLSPACDVHPVIETAGHYNVVAKLIGEDKAFYALELGWVRVLNRPLSGTVYFEHGNSKRPTARQLKWLKDFAIDHDFKLVCDNTGREVYSNAVAESKPQKSGLESWKSRYYTNGVPNPAKRIRKTTPSGTSLAKG